jgi:FkbM family methyltransferase
MQLIQGSFLAHPRMVSWRNRLRGNALLRSVYRMWAGRGSYEERFGRGLLQAVSPGDVVWDIGANIGLYTEKFLAKGASSVVCFEPAPDAIRALQGKFSADAGRAARVRIVPAALSNARGVARFMADGASPVNRLAAGDRDGSAIEVSVMRGDEAVSEYALPPPDIIKVDVEGFELEVIEGLAGVLAEGSVRAVFVEVHFALLHERGVDHAPARIVEILQRNALKVSWLDASHLAAARVS